MKPLKMEICSLQYRIKKHFVLTFKKIGGPGKYQYSMLLFQNVSIQSNLH